MLDSDLLRKVIQSVRLAEDGPLSFSAVSTDTRQLQKGSLFVPLVGDRFNGHHFIDAAISNGAVAAIWEESEQLPESLPDDFQLYFVKDTLIALQQMAKAYREAVNPTVVGITGSNGKTTTKDLLYSILSVHKKTHKTEGNFNNHIGLPLTMLAMPSSTQYLIVEMGMSDFGEIALLSELAQPDLAIVTNIGESHMEQVGSREGIAKAKMEITEHLAQDGYVIFDGDEPLLQSYKDDHSLTVGLNEGCDIIITNIEPSEYGFTFDYNQTLHVQLPLIGEHNVKNASYCIAIAKKLGIGNTIIMEGLQHITLTNMRLQQVVGTSGELIINDAYNASPTSMKAAIDTLKLIPNYMKYIAVLGDIYELGKEEERLHREIVHSITLPITDVVFVGEKAKWMADEWQQHGDPSIAVYETESKEDAAQYIKKIVDEKSVILFKASRGMKFEDIIERYQEKGKGDVE